jgi:glycosyltransferase involved in cell wall biosynthesis
LTTTAVPWPLLEEKGCGWRVEPNVDGIAEGLRRAIGRTPAELRRMGEVGRSAVAESFGWRRIAAQLVSIYQEVKCSL